MNAGHSSANPPPELRDIERAAAGWVLRLQHGLTAAEEREFDGWLQRDRRHADILAEMQETSQLLDQLRGSALAGTPAQCMAPSPLAVATSSRQSGKRLRWLVPAGIAAAAAFAVAWVTWSRPRTAPQLFAQSATTEVGGLQKLNLPDGSYVQLNTDSAIEVGYTTTGRRVRLKRGEAFFTVARDAARPFWVDAGAVSMRAVGTAFNVRFRAESVEVLVKEGKVSVNQPAVSPPGAVNAVDVPVRPMPDPRLVEAGEKALITLAVDTRSPAVPIAVVTVAPPRIQSILAWQTRRLEFADTPLSEVVAEFNRYNRHQLVITDPELAVQTFGGAFAPNGYDSLIEVLVQSFGVVAEHKVGSTILRRAAVGSGR